MLNMSAEAIITCKVRFTEHQIIAVLKRTYPTKQKPSHRLGSLNSGARTRTNAVRR